MSVRTQPRVGDGVPRRALSHELWCVDLSSSGEALRELERRTPRLSDEERSSASAERFITRVALRLLLECRLGAQVRRVPFARGAHGKPEIAGAAFSVSHSGGLALIAIDEGSSVGADLERERPVRVRQPRRGQIEAAGAALEPELPFSAADDARFLQAWVRLEALAKAEGCGIGRLLTRLGIARRGTGSIEAAAALARAARVAADMTIHDVDLGAGTFAAAAFAAARARPEPRWLPADLDGLEELVR